jgi:hypothetical protein
MGLWLESFGYKFTWLKPKIEEEKLLENARIQALKRDLSRSMMEELAVIIEEAQESSLEDWHKAALRGFERVQKVIRIARGEKE